MAMWLLSVGSVNGNDVPTPLEVREMGIGTWVHGLARWLEGSCHREFSSGKKQHFDRILAIAKNILGVAAGGGNTRSHGSIEIMQVNYKNQSRSTRNSYRFNRPLETNSHAKNCLYWCRELGFYAQVGA